MSVDRTSFDIDAGTHFVASLTSATADLESRLQLNALEADLAHWIAGDLSSVRSYIDQAQSLGDSVSAIVDRFAPAGSYQRHAFDFLAGDVASHWNNGGEYFPGGSVLATGLRLNRVRGVVTGSAILRGSYTTTAFVTAESGLLGRVASSAMQSRVMPEAVQRAGARPFFNATPANQGWRAAASWSNMTNVSRVFRGAGIAGGAYSTVTGAIEVYQQGNPVDAFHREGAGYVADVAGTAFSASSTAFLIAPNPVTGGIMLVTGAVWVGAEVWDHYGDEIGEFVTNSDAYRGATVLWDAGVETWQDTTRGASMAWNATSDFTSDAWNSGTEFATSSWNSAANTVESTTEFASNTWSNTTQAASEVASETWDSTTAFAGNTWDSGTGLAGDVADDIGHAIDPRNWF